MKRFSAFCVILSIFAGFLNAQSSQGTTSFKGFNASILSVPSLYYREVLRGNFISSAVSFWDNATSRVLNVSGIPPSASVVKALLFWGCECNSPSDLSNINFNGNPITGTIIGSTSTLCWVTSSYYNYVADVTLYVPGNGSYTIQVPRALSSTPGADGATLYVVYCDNSEPVRTITVFAGAEFVVGPSSVSWTQTGFNGTASPNAKASLTVGDCQDGIPNYAEFNSSFMGYFDGSSPGNHYGLGEWDVSSLVGSFATSVSWRLVAACPSACDCISPNVSVLSITSTDPITLTCSADYDDPINVSERGKESEFKVSATKGGIRIYSDRNTRVKIYTHDGKLVKDVDVKAGITNVELKKGVYFVVGKKREVVLLR